jgi:2-oxoglutarate dehydrogenase E2 component (dihydrolipoamide succinyltransferase)
MVAQTHIEVVMPQMGVSVSEGTIVKWLKSEGEAIKADEPLLEISTDKVDTEVPSPADGVLDRIVKLEGETVPVGTTIALVTPTDAAAGKSGLLSEPVSAASSAGAQETAISVPNGPGGGRTFVSPVVARIAAEQSIDLSLVPGSGRGGRVTKKDLLDHIERTVSAEAETVSQPQAAPAPGSRPQPSSVPHFETPGERQERETPGERHERMSQMRLGIAEHMRRSLDTAAHATTVFEVDMSRVVEIRTRLKPEYLGTHGVRLTYLSFVARATVEALRNWPWLNGEVRGEEVVTRGFVNLSIAVALDESKGLIVPVIRNAEGLNLLGIARAIQDLSERARAKRLVPDEVQGGTFTITNPGGYGSIIGTPIINQPQVAILDVEALVKRPVVISDETGADAIAVRPMMNLCLSFDHRLIDGAYAVQFMAEVRANLQNWNEERY